MDRFMRATAESRGGPVSGMGVSRPCAGASPIWPLRGSLSESAPVTRRNGEHSARFLFYIRGKEA